MTLDATDLVSIGNLATVVQASVPRIQRELDRLGIRPALTLNGIPHYPAEIADQLFRVPGIARSHSADGGPKVSYR